LNENPAGGTPAGFFFLNLRVAAGWINPPKRNTLNPVRRSPAHQERGHGAENKRKEREESKRRLGINFHCEGCVMKFSNLGNLGIGGRIGAGFVLVIVASLAIALFGSWRLRGVGEEVRLLAEDRMVKVEQLGGIKDNVNIIARSIRNIALMSDAKVQETEKKRIDDSITANAALFQKLEAAADTPEAKAQLKAANDMRGPYNAAIRSTLDLAMGGKRDEAAAALLGPVRAVQAPYLSALDKLMDTQSKMARASAEGAQATIMRASIIMLGLACITALAGLFVAWLVARSITVPIREAVQVAETVAAGDLTSHIDTTRRDETGQLLAALQKMNASLAHMVSLVRQSSESIATGSTQIAIGSQDLSNRTEQQASSLEETAASMEELTSTVTHNAENARQASQLAHAASQVAEQGGVAVNSVISTMDEITASSRKMSDIISVIDGIAFQTNILALNAAVEAARAGEQGRGFAVVASEVRGLAQRSAGAAREIRTLIETSVARIEAGSKQVSSAGATMKDLEQQVRGVTTLIGEISNATREQTSGLSQINAAVAQLDQTTQQNAALVEESSAAADSLKQQAAQLAQTVSVFRLGAGGPPLLPA
jgi:methyl-accepting chemotaxis protein